MAEDETTTAAMGEGNEEAWRNDARATGAALGAGELTAGLAVTGLTTGLSAGFASGLDWGLATGLTAFLATAFTAGLTGLAALATGFTTLTGFFAAGLTGLAGLTADLRAPADAGFLAAPDFTGVDLATGFDPFGAAFGAGLAADWLLATTVLALALEDTDTFPGLAFTFCPLAKKLTAKEVILYTRMAAPCKAAAGFLLARECTAFRPGFVPGPAEKYRAASPAQ